jgi:hypothetical protein
LVVMIPFHVQGGKLVPLEESSLVLQRTFELNGGAAGKEGEDTSLVVMIPFRVEGDQAVPAENSSFVLQRTFELKQGAATVKESADDSLVVMIPFQLQGAKPVPQLDGGAPDFVVDSKAGYTGGKFRLDGGGEAVAQGGDPDFVVKSGDTYTGGKLQLDSDAVVTKSEDPNFVVGNGAGYTGGKLQLNGGAAPAKDGKDTSFVVMIPFQLQGDKLVRVEDSNFVLQGTFELNSGIAATEKPLIVESPDWRFQLNGGGVAGSTFTIQPTLVIKAGEGRSVVARYKTLRNGRKSENSQIETVGTGNKFIVYAKSPEPRNAPIWTFQEVALEVNWKPSGASSDLVLISPDSARNLDERLVLPAQYRVRKWALSGDCFTTIAAQSWAYGDARKWRIIYEANKEKLPDPSNPNLIRPGTVLDIPSIDGERRFGIWEEAPPIIAGGTRG